MRNKGRPVGQSGKIRYRKRKIKIKDEKQMLYTYAEPKPANNPYEEELKLNLQGESSLKNERPIDDVLPAADVGARKGIATSKFVKISQGGTCTPK